MSQALMTRKGLTVIYGQCSREGLLLTLGSGNSVGLMLNPSINIWRGQNAALLILGLMGGVPKHDSDSDPQVPVIPLGSGDLHGRIC